MSDTKADSQSQNPDTSATQDEQPAKKLSPLEAKKQLQAQQRQGLMKKTQGVNAVRDGAGATTGNTDAPPPRTNTPRRAGGS